jgi:poly-gamma-glutamate capsule biosynthesis protein CapA/YwtB (metallophosphatase superfamily)
MRLGWMWALMLVCATLSADAGDGRAHEVRLLAVGDVNLGRRIGQRILGGDTLYPFAAVRDTFACYDIVFANLESTISDQHGETESRGSNVVFTAPPAAAWSLRRGGITIVSTANNHALDYGRGARDATLAYLAGAGVMGVGTAGDSTRLAGPAVIERNGVRIAFFAVTALMNVRGNGWKSSVAAADTALILPHLRAWRDSADFIILSYHGGVEYASRPDDETVTFCRAAADAGADLILGHHPHVPYGVEHRGQALIVHSLGNFVFRQPDRYWTQYSYGIAVDIVKDTAGAATASIDVRPLRAGFQPAFLPPGPDADIILKRIKTLSR